MRIRVLRGWGNVVIWAERVSRVGRVSTGCLLLSLVCSPINFPVGTTGYLASGEYFVNFYFSLDPYIINPGFIKDDFCHRCIQKTVNRFFLLLKS